MREFHHEFEHLHFTNESRGDFETLTKIRRSIEGLHQVLNLSLKVGYSIVIPIKEPNLILLKRALDSAFSQTAPFFEVILKLEEALTGDVKKLIDQYPKLKINSVPETSENVCHYIFILNQNQWMRMDALYRYEQILRHLLKNKNLGKFVLHTEPVKLDQDGLMLPGELSIKTRKINLPYEVQDFKLSGMLLPLEIWDGNTDCNLKMIQDLDILLGTFHVVDFPLLAETKSHKTYCSAIENLSSFRNYINSKGFNWDVEEGFTKERVRLKPLLVARPQIHVIIPYKDAKEMTLRSVRSILKSKGVDVFLTLIDNKSTDTTIRDDLRALKCEVICMDEPFNYSRLNNRAVKETRHPQELILFLNNDAELDSFALEEMARFLQNENCKDIGFVGCRLHYPQGPIQHAGVTLHENFLLEGHHCWMHQEAGMSFEQSSLSQNIQIVDAVTAAAAMCRRCDFLAVDGFDEILYPIAYSDTHLAQKLLKKGLKSLYTPYAQGIHHESMTRTAENREDFERSTFLNQISCL